MKHTFVPRTRSILRGMLRREAALLKRSYNAALRTIGRNSSRDSFARWKPHN